MFNYFIRLVLKKKNELQEEGRQDSEDYEVLCIIEANLSKLKTVYENAHGKPEKKRPPAGTPKQQKRVSISKVANFPAAKRFV